MLPMTGGGHGPVFTPHVWSPTFITMAGRQQAPTDTSAVAPQHHVTTRGGCRGGSRGMTPEGYLSPQKRGYSRH